AAAIGAQLPISEPAGNMVVDVGGGTTEVAVISLGSIVVSQSLRVGGYDLDDAITNHLKRERTLAVGEQTVENLKLEAGSASARDRPPHHVQPAMTGSAADGRSHRLADGNEIPLLGLGVWQVPNGPECVNAVRWALELGYRHIDTAQAYGNEESVGRALRESGVPREEVFITTKFYPARDDPASEVERSLRRLGVDQVDLYIIHWPQGGPTWAWPGMERARERGHARSIGVSNFDVGELGEVIAEANVRPSVNQIQFD